MALIREMNSGDAARIFVRTNIQTALSGRHRWEREGIHSHEKSRRVTKMEKRRAEREREIEQKDAKDAKKRESREYWSSRIRLPFGRYFFPFPLFVTLRDFLWLF
jgi:hypothetical protein